MNKHRKHRRSHGRHGSGWFHIPHYHGQRKIHRKDLIKGSVLLAVMLVAAFSIYRVIHHWEQEKFAVSEDSLLVQPTKGKAPPQTVMVDGTRYELYTNLDVYLLIGVDVDGKVADMNPLDGGGQGDAQMVLVLNHENKTWQVLQLNRDSMVEVPVLGLTGKVMGSRVMQLALAHAYGSGAEDSCRNNANVVSALLWDQFIEGYVALNMDGIAPINDALGGVEVTILPEYGITDPAMTPGSTVLLNGEQALWFLRGRQGVGDETNLSRMGRHRQYLEALTEKIEKLDVSTLTEAYEAAQDYEVSNLNTAAVMEIAHKLKAYDRLELLTVKGTDTVQDDHAAYILDEADLQNVILQLLYRKCT